MIHEFFSRSHTSWNLKDFSKSFLHQAPEGQRTFSALGSAWASSLDAVRREENQESPRSRKAHFLRGQWDQNPAEKRQARGTIESFKATHPSVNVHVASNNRNSNTTVISGAQTVYGGSIELTGNGNKRGGSILSSASEDAPRNKRRKRKKGQEIGSKSGVWLQRFVDMYNVMDSGKKIQLSTGTVVEDTIFAHARLLEQQAPVHSFIVDTENSFLEKLFKPEEWMEIVSHVDSRQKVFQNAVTPQFLDWIPDDVTTAVQLRKILYGCEQPQGSDEEWVSDVYRQFLFLLEHPDKPLTRDHCENWYEVTLLGRLVGRCIMTLSGVEVLCKEFVSVATRRHLNYNRTQTGSGNHLVPCPRLDSIFRLTQPPMYEFGACEVGKYDKGPEDTKRIGDFNKLITTLSHMVLRLHREVKLGCPQELEVVGLLCSGLTFQPFRLYSPNGYLCFLVRCETLRIPAHEKRIKDIKPLLKSMWLVKRIIGNSVDLLLGSSAGKAQ